MNSIQQILSQTKIDPKEAEILLAHVIKKPREFVLAHPEFKIDDLRFKIIKKLISKRAKGEPIAYLIGHKEFFGLDFVVNKNVLIPRPDTEIMVEEVIKKFQISLPRRQAGDFRFQNAILIDVGTGSGCIPISILKNLSYNPSPYEGEARRGFRLQTFAIDISKKALQIARLNAKKNKVKIKFLHGDLLEPISDLRFQISDLIIITANLPYLTTKQYHNSLSIKHEPKNALVAGKDGLRYYKKLLTQTRHLFLNLKSPACRRGREIYIFLEIDPSQTKSITLLIKKILPNTNVQIIKDLAGLDRIVKVCYTR